MGPFHYKKDGTITAPKKAGFFLKKNTHLLFFITTFV